jgi:hypothetical protein
MRPRTPPLIEQWTRPTTPDDHRRDVHSCSASGHRYQPCARVGARQGRFAELGHLVLESNICSVMVRPLHPCEDGER